MEAEWLPTSEHTGRYTTKRRAQYHYAVRQVKIKIKSDILKSNSIAQTFAENDPSKFWQAIHEFIGKKKSSDNIDGETYSNKIANNCACNY